MGFVLLLFLAAAQDRSSRFEVASVFNTYHAPDYLVSRQFQLGGRSTWNWLAHLDLEGEYDSPPNTGLICFKRPE